MKYIFLILLFATSAIAQECNPDTPWHFLKKGDYTFSSDVDALEFSGTLNKRIYIAEVGGCCIPINSPLRGSANTAWEIQAVTTGVAIRGSLAGYKLAL